MTGLDGSTADGQRGEFAAERHQLILAVLAERGRARTSELAALLDVAEPTIRRDVALLDRRGLLTRTHGGAIARRAQLEPDLPVRIARNAAAKTAIARACVAMIGDGDAIYLDAGSTTLRIAEVLVEGLADDTPARRNVNVLTNAVPVAQRLAQHPAVRHTLLGGTYRPAGACVVGPLALGSLQTFAVNTAFIGVTGVVDRGFTVADLAEAQLKAAVMRPARRVVVPMDLSKLGAEDFAHLCALDAVTTLVVDRVHQGVARLAAQAGIELVVAEG